MTEEEYLLTPQAIRDRMLEIEARCGGDHESIAAFCMRALRIDPRGQEHFEKALLAEAGRARLVTANWYGRRVAVLPDDQATVVAMVQGMTFAVAVKELLEGDA